MAKKVIYKGHKIRAFEATKKAYLIEVQTVEDSHTSFRFNFTTSSAEEGITISKNTIDSGIPNKVQVGVLLQALDDIKNDKSIGFDADNHLGIDMELTDKEIEKIFFGDKSKIICSIGGNIFVNQLVTPEGKEFLLKNTFDYFEVEKIVDKHVYPIIESAIDDEERGYNVAEFSSFYLDALGDEKSQVNFYRLFYREMWGHTFQDDYVYAKTREEVNAVIERRINHFINTGL